MNAVVAVRNNLTTNVYLRSALFERNYRTMPLNIGNDEESRLRLFSGVERVWAYTRDRGILHMESGQWSGENLPDTIPPFFTRLKD